MWSVVWSSRLSSIVSFTIIFCFAFFGRTGYAQIPAWVVEDEGCRTPDHGVGNCTPLTQCQPMVTLLKSLKRPIPQAILKKVQAYTCGSTQGGIKVCCPSGPINIQLPHTAPIPGSSGPPDVSNHRNLYLLPSDCGYIGETDKIVNGEDAYLNEFPWMALLSYKKRNGFSFKCGGTIINKNYILTAGHCITGLTSPLVSVRVGEHSIKNETDCETIRRKTTCNPPVQDVSIEQVIPHPQFGDKSFLNDIGLIRVSSMNLDVVNARPVCLPVGKLKPYTSVTVTGWGVNNSATGQTSDILQKVGLKIANKETCAKTYEGHNIKLGNAQICAGGLDKKDSCPGDSGGPMMVAIIDDSDNTKYIQEGIVSFGPKYCGNGYPGVYTLVKYYMDWILDTIRP